MYIAYQGNVSSDEVTRDYVMGAVDSNLRTVRLLPWFYHNVIDLVPNDPLPPRTMDDLDNEVLYLDD